ncbi:MAG: DUF3021 domain-containing protein [Clostridia bacterium]|nr:DUF3021 domain-containing protein [Clostridia bacterium]
MKTYWKMFMHRGLIFGGFGPMVAGIVFCVLDATLEDFSIGGDQILLAIVSTYLLAFLQAGSSVFHQIEHWSPARSLLAHFLTLYTAYVGCYWVNSWIPFEPFVILIFTAVFAVSYFVICLTVFVTVKIIQKRINANLKKR